jgi:hypothetical protein
MMGKMSQLLQIKQQQQALRSSTAEAASAEQSQRQRAALAKYDWNKHLGADGTIDLNTAGDPELMAAAGDQYQQVLQNMVAAKSSQLEAKSKLTALRGDQREAFGQMMNSLRSDSDVAEDNERGRQKVNEEMIKYGEMYGEDVLPVLEAYAKPLQKAPKGRMADALRAIGLQSVSVSDAMAKQQPQYAGAGNRLTNVNPLAIGAKDIPLGISPGMSTMVDPRTGNPLTINEQTGAVGNLGEGFPGDAPGTPTPQHWSQSPPQRPAGMPAPFVPGQKEATEAAAAGVAARGVEAQQKAESSAQAIDSLSRARTILDGDIDTGGGFEAITKMKNALSGIAGFDNAGTDANSLVKNLARYQASRATSAGLGNTDAARELAEKGSPNTKINKGALKGIVTQSLAVEQALLGFAKIQTTSNDPQQLIANEREFRSTPHLIQAYEYGLARTPEDAEEFLHHHKLDAADIGKSRARLKKLGAL